MGSGGTGHCCLDCKDYSGNRVIFHEKRRLNKSRTHTELADMSENGFVKKNIPNSLQKPTYVFRDLTNAKVRNYYKEESFIDTPLSRVYFYTKVVVATMWYPWVILTAYGTQYIKEELPGICLYQNK